MTTLAQSFDLSDRVVIITGGAGFLGRQHAQVVLEQKGTAILLDINSDRLREAAQSLQTSPGSTVHCFPTDITQPEAIEKTRAKILSEAGRIDVLINNAANDPKVENKTLSGGNASRVEHFLLDQWKKDLDVGLTGAFLCSKVFGSEMAKNGKGVILNIASDLAMIGPDQRLYRNENLPEEQQPVKPVSYSVVKAGLLGLTRYLATYWASNGVRVNALSPGGIQTTQDEGFVQRLSQLIPMGRMAKAGEYKSAVAFLISDASSYMTGANVVMDGGRTSW